MFLTRDKLFKLVNPIVSGIQPSFRRTEFFLHRQILFHQLLIRSAGGEEERTDLLLDSTESFEIILQCFQFPLLGS